MSLPPCRPSGMRQGARRLLSRCPVCSPARPCSESGPQGYPLRAQAASTATAALPRMTRTCRSSPARCCSPPAGEWCCYQSPPATLPPYRPVPAAAADSAAAQGPAYRSVPRGAGGCVRDRPTSELFRTRRAAGCFRERVRVRVRACACVHHSRDAGQHACVHQCMRDPGCFACVCAVCVASQPGAAMSSPHTDSAFWNASASSTYLRPVPAQMWASPGADVGQSRRRCGQVCVICV